MHPEDLERVEKSIADQIQGNPRQFDYVEYRIIAKDGSVKWIEDFGHFVKKGNVSTLPWHSTTIGAISYKLKMISMVSFFFLSPIRWKRD